MANTASWTFPAELKIQIHTSDGRSWAIFEHSERWDPVSASLPHPSGTPLVWKMIISALPNAIISYFNVLIPKCTIKDVWEMELKWITDGLSSYARLSWINGRAEALPRVKFGLWWRSDLGWAVNKKSTSAYDLWCKNVDINFIRR